MAAPMLLCQHRKVSWISLESQHWNRIIRESLVHKESSEATIKNHVAKYQHFSEEYRILDIFKAWEMSSSTTNYIITRDRVSSISVEVLDTVHVISRCDANRCESKKGLSSLQTSRSSIKFETCRVLFFSRAVLLVAPSGRLCLPDSLFRFDVPSLGLKIFSRRRFCVLLTKIEDEDFVRSSVLAPSRCVR
ncbi:hypothetical protein NPIL_484731 [Nephila pilipes]|uniref:Uncharacterized protein n=1 Tax=Nephila pilipes TaxID=299642 RepID=A0A8X6U5A0_NEPPI|nr:hypothetical protein NPIL_484731 [Nephila pilipes]